MMNETLYFAKIQKTYLFHDIKSLFKEANHPKSGEISPKLKLFIAKHESLGQWFFIKATSSCPSIDHYGYTMQLSPRDWEEIYLRWIKEETFLCARFLDSLTDEEIISKCEDRENGFKIAAKMKQEDFDRFLEMYKTSRDQLEKNNPAISSMADFALLGVEISDYAQDALKTLNLL